MQQEARIYLNFVFSEKVFPSAGVMGATLRSSAAKSGHVEPQLSTIVVPVMVAPIPRPLHRN